MPISKPIIAGESTLSFTRSDALAVIGRKMSGGVDYDPLQWDAQQTWDANEALKSALNLFYGSHDWSFLKPWATIALEVGIASYDLPEDYAGMIGNIGYIGRWSGNAPAMQTDMHTIEVELARNTKGYPTRYGIEFLPHSGESQGQRQAIKFNRLPSSAAEMRCQYFVHPYDLSTTRTYPLGGQAHAECLKYACIAMVEVGVQEVVNGPAMQHFNRLLADSIRIDKRNSPTHLGVMGSRRLLPSSATQPMYDGQITYNGNAIN